MTTYNTKQKREIYELLENNKEIHFSIEDIKTELDKKNVKIGKTTIYRNINSLKKEGKVERITYDDNKGAKYHFLEEKNNQYHFKCDKCGSIIHLDCKYLNDVKEHLSYNHNFSINRINSIFYGICKICNENNNYNL